MFYEEPYEIPAVKEDIIPEIDGEFFVTSIVGSVSARKITGVFTKPSMYGIFN